MDRSLPAVLISINSDRPVINLSVGMGRSSGSTVVEESPPASCCRVLPIIDEEEEESVSEIISEGASAAPETITRRRRKQAVVARMRELLRRAAAEQSAHSHRLRSSTLATAKKWKRAVRLIRISRSRDGDDDGRQDDRMSSSSVSSFSSSWDAASKTSVSPQRWLDPPVSPPACRRMASTQWITTDSDFVVLEL